MEQESFNLFDSAADKPIIPSLDQELSEGVIETEELKKQLKSGIDLMSEGLDRAIRGEEVKSMMISEESFIALPNYVIDITEVEVMGDHHSEAIDALLNEDGDVVVYAYTKTGMVKLGRGMSETLDKIIAPAIDNLFSSAAKVYRDFQPGKPLTIVSSKDIETMRLNI